MRDVAVYVGWHHLFGIFALTVALLVISGLIRGGPVLSDTALVSLPIVFALFIGSHAWLRRRYRDDREDVRRRSNDSEGAQRTTR